MIPSDVSNAMSIMSQTHPSGCTTPTEHITEIHSSISAMKESLQSEGKRAVVVLATDGLPTNEYGECNSYIKDSFVRSLKKLEGLLVWLVVRLSTDEEEVVVSTTSEVRGLFIASINSSVHFTFRTSTTALTIN